MEVIICIENINRKQHYMTNEEIIEIKFSGKVPVKIFLFRHLIDDFAGEWEADYVRELIDTLTLGMTVYDIGAENGELTILAGNIIGGENVHIFEPNKDYFPNIKTIWEANNLKNPANCFNGYVYEKSDKDIKYGKLKDLGEGEIFYGCRHINHIDTPMQMVSLDDYCQIFKRPDVVMMDIEGGELSAVKGAKNLIKEYSPIFFISIHKPEFIMHRSDGTKEDLIKIFTDEGYSAIHLSTDHEEHWKFIK